MLAVIQFLIADFRPFLCRGGERLPTPGWPPRTGIPREFVRSFGPAVPRRRGVDWAWADEHAFYRADRALRFKRLPASTDGWHGQVRCAFRRLLSDGEAVTRVEIGLSCNSLQTDSRMWKHWDDSIEMGRDPTANAPNIRPLDLAAHISELTSVVPLQVDGAKGSADQTVAKRTRPLSQQGRALAKLFLNATSGPAALAVAEQWYKLVGVGAPVVLVEVRASWSENLPKGFVHIDPDKVGQVKLAFGRMRTPWGPLCVWILGHGKARTMDIRNLRLCLLRLHAEQEVLDSVLDHLGTGALEYRPGESPGNKLEAYLNKATKLIDRCNWAGIDQSAILEAFDASEATEYRAIRADLATRLQGVRRQVRMKLELFEARTFPRTERHLHFHDSATYIEKVETMETHKTINIGAGATINASVTIADQIQSSFNTLDKAAADPQLTELMQTLLKQITQAAESEPEQTKAMATDAETLSKEIARDKPRRKWYELSIEGIKEAAEAIGEMGKPILETTGKLLPLLAALFP